MKVALVFPPQGHFTQPYLSLPSLTAYLRMHGYDEVTQLDENIAAYDWFLSKERLERSLAQVDPAVARNLVLAVERCHLDVEALHGVGPENIAWCEARGGDRQNVRV